MSQRLNKFFGPAQFKRDDEVQVPPPLGKKCVLCEEVISFGDSGTINQLGQITHYECLLRTVIGSVAHQQYQCSCYGGSVEENETGKSFRQSSIEAAQLWKETELLRVATEVAAKAESTAKTNDPFWRSGE